MIHTRYITRQGCLVETLKDARVEHVVLSMEGTYARVKKVKAGLRLRELGVPVGLTLREASEGV